MCTLRSVLANLNCLRSARTLTVIPNEHEMLARKVSERHHARVPLDRSITTSDSGHPTTKGRKRLRRHHFKTFLCLSSRIQGIRSSDRDATTLLNLYALQLADLPGGCLAAGNCVHRKHFDAEFIACCHASAFVYWWLLRGFPVSGLMVFHGGGHLRPSASIDASTNNVASRASIRHRHRLGRDGETGRPTHVALVQRVPSAPASASARNRSALVAGPGILPGVDEPYGLQHASPWLQVGVWLWLLHA